MKLKPIVATMCVLGLGAAGMASAAGNTDAQIANLQAQIQQLQAQMNHMGSGGAPMAKGSGMGGMAGMVNTNPMVSQIVNSDANATGQDIALLHAANNGQLHGLILGGTAQGDAFWAHSGKQTYVGFESDGTTRVGGTASRQGMFNNPYLQSDYSAASNRSAITLTNVKVSMIANLDSWANAVVQLGDSYLGQDLTNLNNTYSSTTASSNDTTVNYAGLNYKDGIQVQQAYVLIGNLSQSPFFGVIGKKYIDFGQFQNVNPFTQPLTRQFFQANGNTAEVGLLAGGYDAQVSVMNGGNHNDVLYASNGAVSQNLYTNRNDNINNFAINAGYGWMHRDIDWHVGVGYLNGGSSSILNLKNTDTDVGKRGPRANHLLDANARMSFNNIDLYGEFVYATRKAAYIVTGASGNNNLFNGNGQHPMGWQVAGDYKFPLMGRKSMFGLGFSGVENVALTQGSYFQMATSVRSEMMHNVWAGVEYAYADGVPVVGEDENGLTTNNQNAHNNTITLDLTAYF